MSKQIKKCEHCQDGKKLPCEFSKNERCKVMSKYQIPHIHECNECDRKHIINPMVIIY